MIRFAFPNLSLEFLMNLLPVAWLEPEGKSRWPSDISLSCKHTVRRRGIDMWARNVFKNKLYLYKSEMRIGLSRTQVASVYLVGFNLRMMHQVNAVDDDQWVYWVKAKARTLNRTLDLCGRRSSWVTSPLRWCLWLLPQLFVIVFISVLGQCVEQFDFK